MAYSGQFKPRNPQKYKGDANNIVFRSTWEFYLYTKMDEWEHVLEWSSEEIVIPYRKPTDNEIHRYFPDCVAKVKLANGGSQTIMIEVKPYKQTQPPKSGKRMTKRLISEAKEYVTNLAKWEAAKQYCKDRGWSFIILTEKQLFQKPNK